MQNLLNRLNNFLTTVDVQTNLSRSEFTTIVDSFKCSTKEKKFLFETFNISRGIYSFAILNNLIEELNKNPIKIESQPVINKTVVVNNPIQQEHTTIDMMTNLPTFNESNFIPAKKDDFVSYGFHPALKKIVKSKKFFTVYITGPSGTGKNIGIEQICSEMNRGMIHTSITEETSEEDLIGCWTLLNGNTVWKDGPVVFAAKHGMICVLDEIDLATPKIMCLQSILNGDAIYIAATGERIIPKAGFTIIATGNTKGFGESDIYVGTQALNEAFLERFKITFEHLFPNEATLKKIINKKLEVLGLKKEEDLQFGEVLTKFVSHISNAYSSGAIQYYISNRRLAFILETYDIFQDKIKSLQYTLNRFPKEISDVFISLYVKMDAGIDTSIEEILKTDENNINIEDEDECAF